MEIIGKPIKLEQTELPQANGKHNNKKGLKLYLEKDFECFKETEIWQRDIISASDVRSKQEILNSFALTTVK